MPSSERTYPLSPLQRTAVGFEERPIVVTVETPLAPGEVIDRATEVMHRVPALTAGLYQSSVSRIPRQKPSKIVRSSTFAEVVKLTAGGLTLEAHKCANGTRLVVCADALFIDAVGIEALFNHIAGSEGIEEAVNFFDVVTEHDAMFREGELKSEQAYWEANRRDCDLHAALGVGLGAENNLATARVSLDRTELDQFARSYDEKPTDVFSICLHLLFDRICPNWASIGRLTDARGIMGLSGTIGNFTHAIWDAAEIRSDASTIELLAEQKIRLKKHGEMAGGPAAFDPKFPPPRLIYDPYRVGMLPKEWSLIDFFNARSGALVVRGFLEDDKAFLVVDTCDGVQVEVLRSVLDAWRDIVLATICEPDAPWRALRLDVNNRRKTPSTPAPPSPNRHAPEDLCTRVRQFALSDPEAVALRQGQHTITRKDLMGRIGALSEALGPIEAGTVVAVLANREPDLLASWLAVLWRGGAFLPLSPAEPPARLERAIAHSDATALIMSTDVQVESMRASCRIIPIRQNATQYVDPGDPLPMDQDCIAYQLRTSGSTGKPKHVAVSRGSLNNYLRWIADDILSGELPVVSSPIFDASLKQLLGPQYSGGITWLLTRDPTDPAEAYAELVNVDAPFLLNCVPTYWAELLEIGERMGRHLLIRKVFLGGEPLSEALVRRTTANYPDAEIWNFYGPTETTATATAGRVEPGKPIHVGSGVAGAAVIVADRFGRPLPRGIKGEVWIVGPGLAKGYVGDVDQKSFSELRLDGRVVSAYRTGDAGRIDEDGMLRIEGRMDEQLKIRGMRMEPQEIECIAENVRGVVKAHLIVDTRDEQQLLRLFYIGDVEEAMVMTNLREWLPSAMVPTSVKRVDRFPKSPTGKLNRDALIQLISATSEGSPEDYDPLQFEIASIWRDILRRGWPRLDEDFFSAGGHSLLLARLVNQVRSRGYEKVSLRKVVRNPTVEEIVSIIRSVEAKEQQSVETPRYDRKHYQTS